MQASNCVDNISVEWLTDVLRDQSVLKQANVIGIRIEQIGLFSSVLRRLHIEYDHVESHAPTSLILKQPMGNRSNRPGSGFTNEVAFYRDIAHLVSVRTPRFYVGCLDTIETNSILILEDINNLVPIDWQQGVTKHHMDRAIKSLASLHAAWWNKTDSLATIPHLADSIYQYQIAEAYEKGWRTSRDYFKAKYGEPFITLGDALIGHIPSTVDQVSNPATLLHGDAHFENIVLIGKEGNEVIFLDWADSCCGLASFDVAVFSVQSLPIIERRRQEKSLVETHAKHMRVFGVPNWTDPWLNYRRGMLYWVIHMIQNANHNIADSRSIVIDRYVTAAIDLNLIELVL